MLIGNLKHVCEPIVQELLVLPPTDYIPSVSKNNSKSKGRVSRKARNTSTIVHGTDSIITTLPITIANQNSCVAASIHLESPSTIASTTISSPPEEEQFILHSNHHRSGVRGGSIREGTDLEITAVSSILRIASAISQRTVDQCTPVSVCSGVTTNESTPQSIDRRTISNHFIQSCDDGVGGSPSGRVVFRDITNSEVVQRTPVAKIVSLRNSIKRASNGIQPKVLRVVAEPLSRGPASILIDR